MFPSLTQMPGNKIPPRPSVEVGYRVRCSFVALITGRLIEVGYRVRCSFVALITGLLIEVGHRGR